MHTHLINITGIVQGVGFRPFVANLARKHGITGTVQNTGGGVEIHATANGNALEAFEKALVDDKPQQAHIAEFSSRTLPHQEFADFSIIESKAKAGVVFVPVDLAICPECSAELDDPSDRRYEYPFINCTQCGPRYTIIEELPYDRPKTTMAEFKMCGECQAEYDTPTDRRYHAQPNACESCGPNVWMDDLHGIDAIKAAAALVDNGKIIVMRGIGGYHIICDATQDEAVLRLRALKNRNIKPFAIMCREPALINAPEEIINEIFSPAAPIVIHDWKEHPLSKHINPLNNEIGVMSAYTPLHKLLLKYTKTGYIVATSGNRQDEAIVADIEEAEKRLRHFSPYFLHHNRPIRTRIDDSVAAVSAGKLRLLRRGRGFAPFPVTLPLSNDCVFFAAGAQLKNCITIVKDQYAFTSQYLGDLDNADTVDFYKETYAQMCKLLNCTPEIAVHDLHEGYFATGFAKSLGIQTVRIQHHHAHMYAAMAEHGIRDNVLAVIMDGTGYGEDGAIWGGEFFALVDEEITREAHIQYIPQAAGDASVKHPSRMAQAWLQQSGAWDDYWIKQMGMDGDTARLNLSMIQNNINTVPTSSAGRLFEAAGAMLLGLGTNEYEGHAAIALEAAAKRSHATDIYPYKFAGEDIILSDCIDALAHDIKANAAAADVAMRFHNTFAKIIFDKIMIMAEKYNINDLLLSGGVFQNRLLLDKVYNMFKNSHINCLIPVNIPVNDGGISLGQAYWAALELSRIAY